MLKLSERKKEKQELLGQLKKTFSGYTYIHTHMYVYTESRCSASQPAVCLTGKGNDKLVSSCKWGGVLFHFFFLWSTFWFFIITAPQILMTVSRGARMKHVPRAAVFAGPWHLLFSSPPCSPLYLPTPPCLLWRWILHSHAAAGRGVLKCPFGNRFSKYNKKHTWLCLLPLSLLL